MSRVHQALQRARLKESGATASHSEPAAKFVVERVERVDRHEWHDRVELKEVAPSAPPPAHAVGAPQVSAPPASPAAVPLASVPLVNAPPAGVSKASAPAAKPPKASTPVVAPTVSAAGAVAPSVPPVPLQPLVTCPDCLRSQTSRNTWKRRLLGVARVSPYRCQFCRRRFSDAESERARAEAQRPAKVPSSFLRPDDGLGFDDLIQEMARVEQEHGKPKPR